MHPLTFMFFHQNCAFSRRELTRFHMGKSIVLMNTVVTRTTEQIYKTVRYGIFQYVDICACAVIYRKSEKDGDFSNKTATPFSIQVCNGDLIKNLPVLIGKWCSTVGIRQSTIGRYWIQGDVGNLVLQISETPVVLLLVLLVLGNIVQQQPQYTVATTRYQYHHSTSSTGTGLFYGWYQVVPAIMHREDARRETRKMSFSLKMKMTTNFGGSSHQYKCIDGSSL